MTSYARHEVERAFTYLQEHARESDVVILGFHGLYALRMHLQAPPLLHPTAEQRSHADIRIAHRATPLRHVWNGIHFYHPRTMSGVPTPQELAAAAAEARRHFLPPGPKRVWMLRSAWQPRMARFFDVLHPDIRYDKKVQRETDGMFAIDIVELTKVPQPEDRSRRVPPQHVD